MTWIRTVAYEDASGSLLDLYDRVKGPKNNVDNILLAHSLRPHTLEGHMALYKAVLHHPRNTIPKWFLEVIGTYTSFLNRCRYCIDHHYAGLLRLLRDRNRAETVRAALESNDLAGAFEPREVAALEYVRKLAEKPTAISAADIEALKSGGWEDGEILEINQAAAYFAYANRMVIGLGIDTDGDVLGLSPGDSTDPASWQHR